MKGYLGPAMSAIALMFVFGSFAVTESSAQVGKIGEVLRRMEAHNKALTTLRADVTMGKQDAALGDEPTITVGTAIYAKRPGKDALVRIDWQRPQESLAVVDGKYIIYRPRLATAYTGSIKDAAKGNGKNESSAFAFMSMTKAQLNASYETALLGDNEVLSSGVRTFHLLLTPKAKTSYKSAELWVDVDGMPLQSKIIENNNDSTTVLLTNLQKNPSLKSSDFLIVPPSGTKIVKS